MRRSVYEGTGTGLNSGAAPSRNLVLTVETFGITAPFQGLANFG
jgi:hypothetical protein